MALGQIYATCKLQETESLRERERERSQKKRESRRKRGGAAWWDWRQKTQGIGFWYVILWCLISYSISPTRLLLYWTTNSLIPYDEMITLTKLPNTGLTCLTSKKLTHLFQKRLNSQHSITSFNKDRVIETRERERRARDNRICGFDGSDPSKTRHPSE